jgi:hypothetical protein
MSDPTMAAPRPAAGEPIVEKEEEEKKRVRAFGIPPPPKFDFDAIADSAWLTSDEVAAVLRRSKTTPPSWRAIKNHPLRWERVDGKPLYRVRALRAFIAARAKKAAPGRT